MLASSPNHAMKPTMLMAAIPVASVSSPLDDVFCFGRIGRNHAWIGFRGGIMKIPCCPLSNLSVTADRSLVNRSKERVAWRCSCALPASTSTKFRGKNLEEGCKHRMPPSGSFIFFVANLISCLCISTEHVLVVVMKMSISHLDQICRFSLHVSIWFFYLLYAFLDEFRVRGIIMYYVLFRMTAYSLSFFGKKIQRKSYFVVEGLEKYWCLKLLLPK